MSKFKKINDSFFQIALITYLFLFLVNKVSYNIKLVNLNYLLILVIVSGLIYVFTNRKLEEKIEFKVKKLDEIIIIILSLLNGLIIYLKSSDLGINISIIMSLGITIMSYFLLSTIINKKIKKFHYILYFILSLIFIIFIINIIDFKNIWEILYLFIIYSPIASFIILFPKKDILEKIGISFILFILFICTILMYVSLINIKINSFIVLLISLLMNGLIIVIKIVKARKE